MATKAAGGRVMSLIGDGSFQMTAQVGRVTRRVTRRVTSGQQLSIYHRASLAPGRPPPQLGHATRLGPHARNRQPSFSCMQRSTAPAAAPARS